MYTTLEQVNIDIAEAINNELNQMGLVKTAVCCRASQSTTGRCVLGGGRQAVLQRGERRHG